jgi:predicted acetyltransferase
MSSDRLTLRDYNDETDRDGALRAWKDAGWLANRSDLQAAALELQSGNSTVAEVDGRIDGVANAWRSQMRYEQATLPAVGIAGVAAPLTARRRGITGRVVRRAIAKAARDGAAVATLWAFDQGYYDRLGFGTGSPVRIMRIDPGALNVPDLERPAVRLTKDDAAEMHACRLCRLHCHGAHDLLAPESTRAPLTWDGVVHCLGFRDPDTGELTHHMAINADGNAEFGPWRAWWLAYRTHDQLIELLSLLRSLSDQVAGIVMRDPPGVQLQAMLRTPFRLSRLTAKSKFEVHTRGYAPWQMRMLDLPACLAATSLAGPQVRFNLQVDDPMDGEPGFDSTAGEYVITLGRASAAEPGRDESLPTLRTSIGNLTRLWIGATPAYGLSMLGEIDAPPELVCALDDIIRVPTPHVDWGF